MKLLSWHAPITSVPSSLSSLPPSPFSYSSNLPPSLFLSGRKLGLSILPNNYNYQLKATNLWKKLIIITFLSLNDAR